VTATRRDFITLLGGAAAGWPVAPLAVFAQPAIPTVGYFYGGVPEASGATQAAAFRKGLGEVGYIEGRNVRIEYRWGMNDPARLPELAADLVRLRVAAIAAPSAAPALAAKALTTTIPIVFGTGVDPVEIGLVENFNRPGGNVTGFSNLLSQIASKQFGLFHELIPKAGRFAALVEQGNPLTEPYIKDLQPAAAAAIGRQVEILPVSGSRDIELTFKELAQQQIDGLLIGPAALFGNRRVQL
jgi:putative ABC transport system substrate-binding protein